MILDLTEKQEWLGQLTELKAEVTRSDNTADYALLVSNEHIALAYDGGIAAKSDVSELISAGSSIQS